MRPPELLEMERLRLRLPLVSDATAVFSPILVVVPAAFEYIDDFRVWLEGGVKTLGGR